MQSGSRAADLSIMGMKVWVDVPVAVRQHPMQLAENWLTRLGFTGFNDTRSKHVHAVVYAARIAKWSLVSESIMIASGWPGRHIVRIYDEDFEQAPILLRKVTRILGVISGYVLYCSSKGWEETEQVRVVTVEQAHKLLFTLPATEDHPPMRVLSTIVPPILVKGGRRSRNGPQYGYVYFIVSPVNGGATAVKIGRAKDPTQRLCDLQVGNPHELIILKQVATSDMVQLEQAFHARCAPWRIRGEWFSIPLDEIDGLVSEVTATIRHRQEALKAALHL